MLGEYVRAMPFLLATFVVVGGALWLEASYGPLAIVGGVVGVLVIVLGFVAYQGTRVSRAPRE